MRNVWNHSASLIPVNGTVVTLKELGWDREKDAPQMKIAPQLPVIISKNVLVR